VPRTRPLALLAVLAACTCGLALAGAASAAVTVTDFSVTPSTTQAGGHPNVRISTGFALSPTDDDVRDVTVRLPKGLVGNPNATPKCSSAQFVADACPASTAVGSVQVTADATVLLVTSTVVSNGTVYNLAPAGSEPARLGIMVRPDPIGPVNIQRIALVGVARIGPETGYALETSFANQPREAQSDAGAVPLAIRRIDLTLKGRPGATPFTINPSSCGAATSTATAASYDAPGTPSSRSSSFAPTGCSALPFAPRITGTVGAKGFNRKGAVAPLTTAFDFPAGSATLKDSVVKLPAGLAPDLNALKRACPAATPAASCPKASVVGSAKASSPLLTTALSGPVILQSSSTGGLPKLVVRLLGAVPLTLEGATSSSGASLQNAFPGAPDVPLSRFELKLNGGKAGLLEAPYDLCRKAKPPTAGFTLTGWNGKRVVQKVKLKAGGCAGYRPGKPRVSATLRGSSLRLRLAGAGDARLKKVTITVPKGVRVRRASARGNGKLRSLKLKGRRLTLTARGSGASRLTVTGRKVAVRRGLRGHRAKLKLSAVDSYGRSSRTVTVRIR
jgi:hypothetical protein